MKALIQTVGLTKIYGEESNQVVAVDKTSLRIDRGEFVAIIGPSGSGKSTLMHILGCLDKPTSGKYFLEGRLVSNLSEDSLAELRSQKIGFVFQSFNLLPRTTALKNVELPLVYSHTFKSSRQERAKARLIQLGLGDKLNSRSNQLSGGQQQRVAIARALVNDPVVIMADEPTGNLDSKTSQEIMDILKELNNQGATIIMITHESEIARQAKRIITIRDGKIVDDKLVRPAVKRAKKVNITGKN